MNEGFSYKKWKMIVINVNESTSDTDITGYGSKKF